MIISDNYDNNITPLHLYKRFILITLYYNGRKQHWHLCQGRQHQLCLDGSQSFQSKIFQTKKQQKYLGNVTRNSN